MATFSQTLIAFAVHNANVALSRTEGKAAKAALIRAAARMTDDEKTTVDRQVVHALAARFGIKPQASERPMFSGFTFDQNNNAGKAASVALTRARSILKIEDKQGAAEAIAKLNAVSLASRDPVAALVARFEKLTGGQKRSFRSQIRA